MNKMSSNTKRNPPYVKKEDKKKTEAKNKLKGTIVIHALPMNIPEFQGKDTLMHDSFGGEPPKKYKIVTMYSYIARPPVAQSFVISMITTIITMNVKYRVTPGSPWTELTRWCANVERLPHCH